MINKGDKVICINDTFEPWVHVLYTELPKKDEIYTIRDVVLGVNPKSIEANPDSSLLLKGIHSITLLLEELTNPAMPISQKEMGFGSWRFAPVWTAEDEASEEVTVSRPNIIQIPTPVRELEEIAA
jgi:hypothetical protein